MWTRGSISFELCLTPSITIYEYKAVPISLPNTIGWNSMMSLNNIFNQLMSTYSKPTSDTVHQNNLAFIAIYNPKDPPEILFKWCANCQGIAIITKVPHTNEQMLMHVVNLLMRSGLYTQDMVNWDRRSDADKPPPPPFHPRCIPTSSYIWCHDHRPGGLHVIQQVCQPHD
jgi:hypothetical protein